MTTIVPKETMSRLIKDVKKIIKQPLTDNGIYYIHDDTDMMKGYALIIGPSDTPYFGGNYFFEFTYPSDYPSSPPQVKYWTNGNNIRFNPNLYKCGKVCVSMLNTWRGDQWTSCQTISTTLLTLCTLLCKTPLLNEPGVSSTHKDMANYTTIIEYSNISIAVCDIILKQKDVYIHFFDNFRPFIKENFLQNYDKLEAFVKTQIENDFKESKIIQTDMYKMNVTVDYNSLLEKLKKSKICI
jgi:ubiquitin-conjugating enzyme E2 Z